MVILWYYYGNIMVLLSEGQGRSIGREIDIKRPSKSPLKGDLEGDRCPPQLMETGEKEAEKRKIPHCQGIHEVLMEVWDKIVSIK